MHELIAQLISGDDSIAEDAVQRLGQLGETVLEDLANLLEKHDSDIRWWAIRTLAEIKGDKACKLIQHHLNDKNLAVQQCAAMALRVNISDNSVDILIPLLSHEDQLLSELAADALTAIGTLSTPFLIEVAQKGSQKAQIQAVRALAKLKDIRSISTLFELLDSESALIAHWANQGLENMGVGMVFFNPD